jgi:ribonuclease HI
VAVRLYVDISFADGRAALAVVQAGVGLIYSGVIEAADSNEAELAGLAIAAQLAPEGGRLHTDSGRVWALLRGRVQARPSETPHLNRLKSLMEAKALECRFIGGKRRRRRRAHRKHHRLADTTARSALL